MTFGWPMKRLNSVHGSGGDGELGVGGNWKMIPAREILLSWRLQDWQAGRVGRVGTELGWNPPTSGALSLASFGVLPGTQQAPHQS